MIMNERDKAMLAEIKDDVLSGKDITKCDVVFLIKVITFLQIENKNLNEIWDMKDKKINDLLNYSDDTYIRKDKIIEKIKEYENKKANMTQVIFSKYGKTQKTFKQAVSNEVIKILKELIKN